MKEAFTKPPESYATEKASLYWQKLLTDHSDAMKESMIKFPNHEEFVIDSLQKNTSTHPDPLLNDKDLDSQLRVQIRSVFRKSSFCFTRKKNKCHT
jgi:hypothetical protein